MSNKEGLSIPRRDFLKIVGAFGLSSVLGGCNRESLSSSNFFSENESEKVKLTYLPLNKDSFVYGGGGFIWLERVGLYCQEPKPLQTRWATLTVNYPLGLTEEKFKDELGPILAESGLGPNSKRDNSDTVVLIDDSDRTLAGFVRYDFEKNDWVTIWSSSDEVTRLIDDKKIFQFAQEQGSNLVCSLEANSSWQVTQENLHSPKPPEPENK
ncbi:MAG: hypothetical protein PHX72_02600 [Candidatus Shapirobacteria bacterium]|nr:hypothetical protein [Candidatus Shapirobacteria bacterium]